MNKILIIPAVPSSGTSALAGVFSKLGIDMGSHREKQAKKLRGYKMYEDAYMYDYQVNPDPLTAKSGKITATKFHIREYLEFRLKQPGKFKGAKLPAVWCIGHSCLSSLPILAVDIIRPLEVSMEADMENWRRMHPGKYDGEPHFMIAHEILRGADMGSCHAAKKILFRHCPPVISMTFDNLLKHKEEIVHGIVETLKLPSDEKQIKDAINFLDEDKKHY